MLSWAVFAVFGAACSGLFMGAFTQNAEILAGGTDYMWIVTVFSLGLFMSVTMERVLQVTGKTVYQMISQMTGAVDVYKRQARTRISSSTIIARSMASLLPARSQRAA